MNAAANFAMRDCSANILPLMRASAPAPAAVIRIEYGGGFRHDHRTASKSPAGEISIACNFGVGVPQ